MAESFQADLDILQASPIDLELLDGNLNIIQQLDDEPNDVGGLTSAELKAKFDQAGNMIKQYINETLIPAVLAADATEVSRDGAEKQRAEHETAREAAEAERLAAETDRVTAETARSGAEASRATAETARETAEAGRLAAETDRSAAETSRSAAEADRSAAETARAAAEAARRELEQGRIGNEADRIQAEEARSVWEEYRDGRGYVPGNKVCFEGGSYLCIAACSGIAPSDPAPGDSPGHWLCIAKRGESGNGSGDMVKRIYDPKARQQDIFAYTDGQFSRLKHAALLQRASRSIQNANITGVRTGSAAYAAGKLILFAGRTTGLYSYDAETWNEFTVPAPPCGHSWGLAVCGRNEYAAVELGTAAAAAVIRSTDGVNWEISGTMQWETDSGHSSGIGNMVYDPVHGTYVASRDWEHQSVMVSTDLETWTETQTGAMQSSGGGLICVSGAICYVPASGTGHIFRSTDGGYTWSKVMNQKFSTYSGKYHLVNGVAGLFAIRNEGAYHTVFKSCDNGASWVELSPIVQEGRLAGAEYFNGRYLLLPTQQGNRLLYSENGADWAKALLPRTALWRDLVQMGDFIAAIGSKGEIAVSRDGLTWDGGTDILLNTDGEDISAQVRNAVGASTVELVRYTGNGTYGAEAPCSLTAKRQIKAVIALELSAPGNRMLLPELRGSYAAGKGFAGGSGKMSEDGKTYSWYGSSAAAQLNTAGTVYSFLLIE